jgi:hypothetical protein
VYTNETVQITKRADKFTVLQNWLQWPVLYTYYDSNDDGTIWKVTLVSSITLLEVSFSLLDMSPVMLIVQLSLMFAMC